MERSLRKFVFRGSLSPGAWLTTTFILLALVASCLPALAAITPFIVESRSTGLHYSNYTDVGFAASSGNVNAPGCTPNIGSEYSGTTTYFGPSRYARFSFPVDGTTYPVGWYEVDLAWTSTAGPKFMAVNVYTGADTGATTADTWGNTGGPLGVLFTTQMNQNYINVGVWNKAGDVSMPTAGTYKVSIYSGYKGANSTTSGGWGGDTVSNRVGSGAARFLPSTPTKPTNTLPANNSSTVPVCDNGNELTWVVAAGTSSFDVYFSSNQTLVNSLDASVKVATLTATAPGTTMSWDPDAGGTNCSALTAGVKYYWRVVANNLAAPNTISTNGDLWSFTTTAATVNVVTGIPNPSAGGSCNGPLDVIAGNQCTLIATPGTGYYFSKWTSDLAGTTSVSTAASYVFTPSGDTTLYAQFVVIPTVTGLSVTPTLVCDNTSVVATWTANSASFSELQIDGGAWVNPATSPYTISTAGLAFGTHTVGVKCVNSETHESAVVTATFKVDRSSIRAWNVIGHYPFEPNSTATGTGHRWDKSFFDAPGQVEGNVCARTGNSYPGTSIQPTASGSGNAFTAWTPVTIPSTTDVLDFNAAYCYNTPTTFTEYGVSYLFTYVINSGAAIPNAYLACGSDDGIKVWFNSAYQGGADLYRGCTVDGDIYPSSGGFTINPGVNRLLVKITQGGSGYNAQARLCAAAKADPTWLSQISYQLSDATAPVGGSPAILINGGAATAHSLNVTLTLSATDDMSGVDTMSMSNDESTWTTAPYATSYPWVLTDGAGTKTVYVTFTDRAGNVSPEYTATINVPSGWALSAQACDTNAGTPTGSGIYSNGAPVTVHANPSPGYHLVNWTDDSCGGFSIASTSQDYTFNMKNYDYTLYANYAASPQTLTVSTCTGGTVGGNSGTLVTGQSATVTATPNTNYQFLNWTTDSCGGTAIVSTSASYTFNMPPNNLHLYANFQYIPLLTLVDTPSAGGTSATSGRYASGSTVSVQATANSGYRFFAWTTDAAGVAVISYANPYSYTMPAADTTLYAQYTGADLVFGDSFEGPSSGVSQWSNATTGGTLRATTTQANVGTHALTLDNCGIRCTVAPGNMPAAGHPVVYRLWWRDPGPDSTHFMYADMRGATYPPLLGISANSQTPYYQSRGPSTGYTDMTAATRLYATSTNNVWNRFDILYDGNTDAYYYVNGVQTEHMTGVTAAAIASFYLGNGSGNATIPTYYIDDVAFFTNPVFLTTGAYSGSGTVQAVENGSAMKGTASGYYYPLEQMQLQAVPAPGSIFQKWVDGAGADTSWGSTNPIAPMNSTGVTDQTIKAIFVRDPSMKLLTLVSVPGGGGTLTGAGAYTTGTPATLGATARVGFRFIKWSTNAAGTDTVTSPYTVNADTTLYAIFQFRAFYDSFDKRTAGGDVDMQDTTNPGFNGDFGGNPWFGAAAPDEWVYAGINGTIPHSGANMLISSSGSLNNECAVNLAYRLNDYNNFTGNVFLDWWFYDRTGDGLFRDYAGLSKYSVNPLLGAVGSGQDYNFTDGSLKSHLLQFLAIGAADDQTGAFDVSKYQIRVIGSPDAYANGWINTAVARAIGWHHAKIVLGPAKGGGTNDATFYLDGSLVATKDTTTTGGINALSVYAKDNTVAAADSTGGYFDDFQFGPAGTESVDQWSVIGPYANATQATRLTTDYFAAGTEGGTEATVCASTGKSYNGAAWKVYKSGPESLVSGGGEVDFNKGLVTSTNCAGYMFTYIVNSGAAITDADMTCGSDDGIEVFLNGANIYTNDTYRPITADSDHYGPFTIPAGVSKLLVKVSQGTSDWCGQVRLTHANGTALSGVSYVATDITAPTGSIQINGGAASTGNPAVTLSLSATDDLSGVAQMEFSNDGTTYATPVAYATSEPYTLPGSGSNTVYVKFIDAAGNVSTAYHASINYVNDSTAPSGSIQINGGAASTSSANVTLTLSATDPDDAVALMSFSNDGTTYSTPEAYATSKAWALTSGDGSKTVCVKFTDSHGNTSAPFCATIQLSSCSAPTGTTNVPKISGLWALVDGATVYNLTGKTVSAVWTDGFWIEETDRTAGVKVIYNPATACTVGAAIAAGKSVDVYGTISTGDQRVINATVVVNNGAGTAIKPVGVTEKYTGGKAKNNAPAVTGGKGIYGVGLLVKLAGNVTSADTVGGTFHLDDGSGLTDGTYNGIKVYAGALSVPTSGNKEVTGVVGIVAGNPVIYATSIQ